MKHTNFVGIPRRRHKVTSEAGFAPLAQASRPPASWSHYAIIGLLATVYVFAFATADLWLSPFVANPPALAVAHLGPVSFAPSSGPVLFYSPPVQVPVGGISGHVAVDDLTRRRVSLEPARKASSIAPGGSGAPPQSKTRTLSCYGFPGDHQGHSTASGERFDPNALTAATHYRRVRGRIIDDFPMGSRVRLPKGTVVRINDRCPTRGRLDLTPAAYKAEGGPMPYGLIRDAECVVVK